MMELWLMPHLDEDRGNIFFLEQMVLRLIFILMWQFLKNRLPARWIVGRQGPRAWSLPSRSRI